MDWIKVGKKLVVKGLPLLGGALAGPMGASAGSLLAGALGVADTPTAVHKAISADPSLIVKLKELEVKHSEFLTVADTARIKEVNVTMREESKAERWWTSAWRPFWGFASGTAFLAVSVFVCILAYQAVLGGNPGAMAVIPQMIGAFSALFAIPGAILGVTAWHRGMKQRREAELANG